jgi:hypothetical protein
MGVQILWIRGDNFLLVDLSANFSESLKLSISPRTLVVAY